MDNLDVTTPHSLKGKPKAEVLSSWEMRITPDRDSTVNSFNGFINRFLSVENIVSTTVLVALLLFPFFDIFLSSVFEDKVSGLIGFHFMLIPIEIICLSSSIYFLIYTSKSRTKVTLFYGLDVLEKNWHRAEYN